MILLAISLKMHVVSDFKVTPTKINDHDLKPTSGDVDNLSALSFLEVDGLKSELATYWP